MINAKVHVAVPTAFYADETLNISATLAHAQYLLDHQIESVMLCGSTGEQHSLDLDEKIALARAVDRAEWPQGAEIIFGVSAIRQSHAVRLAQVVAQCERIDAILVGFPPYIRPTQDQARRFVTAITQTAGKPAIIYNNPARTGFDASASTLAQLCMLPDVIGVKDPGGAPKLAEVSREIAPFRARYYAGGELDLHAKVAHGYTYLSSIVGNIAPEETVAWFNALRHGEEYESSARLQELIDQLFAHHPIQFLKEKISAQEGINMGSCRLPLGPIAD
ncbi:dihydrodipicolinate synthase family protein [Corynebacterium diphtheriae]|nr:dihydrodipicolinate synthase family protein [Corynebacterium diphtheriae]CAB0661725.1 dihydrodipicolinate synthase family protein [Corynebacterium diphtheriae]CAB0758116.1 dihydrodipicolinate synthase family protein [Corynebacterium diphtheriae]CAB0977570.1 dihydrodipicolinate synthase family protein [Corynebacterium diphtheriae]